MPEFKNQEDLIKIVQEAVAQDEALREKYQMGDKFRFVRDRLRGLLESLVGEMKSSEDEQTKDKSILAEDEMIVYVYLYNAKGVLLQSWQNMLTPKVFYEYSINRPIYRHKNDIESLLHSKANKLQHAYLSVAVKASHILQSDSKDNLGNPIIKVKEGALLFDKLISFTHNEQDYMLTADAEFIKK